MKVIINNDFGGASLNEEAAERFGVGTYSFDREDAAIIAAIEAGEDVNGSCADLVVVEFPDEATDYTITEYDGLETLLFVLDGKICYGEAEEEDDWEE